MIEGNLTNRSDEKAFPFCMAYRLESKALLMTDGLHRRQSVFVNGKTRQVDGTMTLGELAAACGLDPRRLLVELNGETLPRETWPQHALQHGDRVEFIRVVAGG